MADIPDMLSRLRGVLPARWHAEVNGTLDAVLAGLAEGWAWVHGMVAAVRAQARIATASGRTLDMAAEDYFGPRIRRRAGQGDAAFRAAILRELLRARATRPALEAALTDLTGRPPRIFEPRRPADTGGWGAGCAWGAAGGWGSLALPHQVFVTAWRPLGEGIAGIAGWGAGGAWGGGVAAPGTAAWASLSMLQGQVTDADIRAAVVAVLPAGARAWVRIES
jgi:hypothetical protein